MITTNSKNILLADDSVFFRTELSAILVEAGHHVIFAKDGSEVIKEIEAHPDGIDLLVLDLQMPKVDGFGVLDWMNQNGHVSKFPVLIVTGVYEAGEVLDRLRDLGASGLMTKGFSPEQVIFRVNTLLFPLDDDNRGEKRTPVSLPVDFMVGEASHTGFLLNLSAGGLFLHSREEFLPGTHIRLRFSLPETEGLIEIKGIIRWCTPQIASKDLFGGGGVLFTSIDLGDRILIERFIDQELERLGSGFKKKGPHGDGAK